MMKRMLVVATVVAVAASGAMGAASLVRIDPVGTNTTSAIYAITNDGAYAVGHGTGSTSDRAFLWKASDGSITTNILSGSYLSSGTGVGYRLNPTTQVKELVLGGKQSSGQVGMFLTADGGTTWTRPYSSAGTAPGTSASNSVGGAGITDTAYMVWAEGTSAYSVTRIYGDPIVAGTATKNSPTAIYVNGMSNTGRAAGARRDTSGTRQNVYLDFTTDGGTAAENIFNGLDGTTKGIASAMSGDGKVVFGQSPIAGSGTTNYPYKYTVGGSIVALPLLPGTTGSVSLGYVYGASADGRYAVGMDYRGMEKATLWDTATGNVVDLTWWAQGHGVLDGFTGNLRRAYTIGVNAEGQPVIGGMGVYYDPANPTVALTRGFVLTLPEPATLTLLAFGGLLLRRRR